MLEGVGVRPWSARRSPGATWPGTRPARAELRSPSTSPKASLRARARAVAAAAAAGRIGSVGGTWRASAAGCAARRSAGRDARSADSADACCRLTTSTLALPGVAGAGEFGDLGITTDPVLTYTRPLPDSKVSSGSRDRYDIDIIRRTSPPGHRAHLGRPERRPRDCQARRPARRADSGSGKPVQVMTSATVDEQRTDFLAKGTMLDRQRSASAGISRRTTTSRSTAGWRASATSTRRTPRLGRAGLGGPDRADHSTSSGARGQGGQAELLHVRGHLADAGPAPRSEHAPIPARNGFLSDPYKRLRGQPRRPRQRRAPRHAPPVLLADALPPAPRLLPRHAARRYRLYLDDWGVNAHTFEVAWYRMLWSSFG